MEDNSARTDEAVIFARFVDKQVAVTKINSFTNEYDHFTGLCRSIDGYLNIVLENAEYRSGTEAQESKCLKTCFVTGNSIKHITLA